MSLIDFPDVPIAPGIPDLRRTATGIATVSGVLGVLGRADMFGLLDNILGPRWGVFEKNGRLAISPDSVVSFNYRGEEKIASHPVEDGGFSSYNKVALPYDIRMVIACNGQGQMSRQDILGRLDDLKASIDLYDIVTPDYAYFDVNLIKYDYRRQSRSGVSLLLIEMQFEEVRVTAKSTLPGTMQPAGASPISVGAVKARNPEPKQAASVEDIF